LFLFTVKAEGSRLSIHLLPYTFYLPFGFSTSFTLYQNKKGSSLVWVSRVLLTIGSLRLVFNG
jgi:hypothetical protein